MYSRLIAQVGALSGKGAKQAVIQPDYSPHYCSPCGDYFRLDLVIYDKDIGFSTALSALQTALFVERQLPYLGMFKDPQHDGHLTALLQGWTPLACIALGELSDEGLWPTPRMSNRSALLGAGQYYQLLPEYPGQQGPPVPAGSVDDVSKRFSTVFPGDGAPAARPVRTG